MARARSCEDQLNARIARRLAKAAKPSKRGRKDAPTPEAVTEKRREPIQAQTETQGHYLAALDTAEQVVVLGPAGTGKTFVAAATAADWFMDKTIKRIILARPNAPAGRSIGALPGTMEEKIAPWAVPFTDVLSERMGRVAFEAALRRKAIDIVPFEYMRGRTFKDAFILLDEAQNTTVAEIKMFLTRVGEGSTVVLNGDVEQSDIRENSGLKVVIDMIKRHRMPVPLIEFDIDDVVRSGICAMWVRAFHADKV